jgi:predicted aspartyl protease
VRLRKSIAAKFALAALSAALAIACRSPLMADDAPMAPVLAQLGSRQEEVAAINKILAAMLAGDLKTVADIYTSNSDPAVHVVGAMVVERMHYNLDASTKDARICQDSLINDRPGIALTCGQFESGNLRLAGRDADAIAKQEELVKRFQGHGVDKALANMQAFLDQSAKRPPLSIERPTGTITIPLIDPEHRISPVFKAEANGHSLDVMLDTGATNFVVDKAKANELGVELIDDARYSGWLTHDAPGQHGLLKQLTISGITWHNVPVLVVSDPIALIGVNMVAPLGTVRVSKDTLTISDGDASTAACDAPMLTVTDVWGSRLRLIPPLQIEDQWHSVLLDTGAYRYLIGTKEALEQATALHRGKTGMIDIGGKHIANTQSAKVKLTISGQPIDMYFDIYTDSENRWPITLGAGALRDMDFLLDFKHQHLCFLLHPNLH